MPNKIGELINCATPASLKDLRASHGSPDRDPHCYRLADLIAFSLILWHLRLWLYCTLTQHQPPSPITWCKLDNPATSDIWKCLYKCVSYVSMHICDTLYPFPWQLNPLNWMKFYCSWIQLISAGYSDTYISTYVCISRYVQRNQLVFYIFHVFQCFGNTML